MHVEVVTNIIPGWNDDDEQLLGIAGWIARDLGHLTPWHVTRFFPMHRLQSAMATPLAAIQHAIDIGRAAGLKFVYSGNVRGQGEDTVCYSCGRTVIRRVGYHAEVLALHGSVCGHCGTELNFRGVGETVAGRREGRTDPSQPEGGTL